MQVSSEDTLTKLVNFITNENGVFVWCRNKKFLKKIKPSIGSSEVGVGVMRRLIQLRKSFDPKLIFYGHQRYEKYF